MEMGVEGCLVCPTVFKTDVSSSLLWWVRFPPTLAKRRAGACAPALSLSKNGYAVF